MKKDEYYDELIKMKCVYQFMQMIAIRFLIIGILKIFHNFLF